VVYCSKMCSRCWNHESNHWVWWEGPL
jgi:hypothetical protein